MAEKPILNDPDVFPSGGVLQDVLGEAKPTYDALMESITGYHPDVTIDWKFYNDGKSWLCKISHKKKTVCWLSVWEGMFKVTFYFNPKTAPGVEQLDIPETVKRRLMDLDTSRKFLPLTFEIRTLSDIEWIDPVFRYKKRVG